MPRFTPLRSGALLFALMLLPGCGRNEIQVYQVAKETPANQAPATREPANSGSALPSLTWKLPAGWEEVPAGEMRLASFRVKASDGQTADVGIFPLPGMAGSDLNNVNRWRGQVGQGAVTEEELAKMAEAVPVSGTTAKLYEQAGENPGSGDKTRILAAILRREGVAWFFKMTGPDALVSQQKAAFVDWMKSLAFAAQPALPHDHPPMQDTATTAPVAAAQGASGSKPQWQVPNGWREAAAGQFLAAKFTVSGNANEEAAVNVSMSAGEGGGVAGNVNRWRRQVGLQEVPESELSSLVTAIEASGIKASLVDMTGTDPRTGQKTRLVGAIVPRQGQTWFYKLMGPESLVQGQKEAFQQFVQTARYPADTRE